MASRCCFKLLLVTALIAVVIAKPYDVASILQNVPEKQRVQFLKHHIQLGYELVGIDNKVNKTPFPDLPELPKEFSVALYEYARKEYAVHNDGLMSVLSNIICFPNGECIDIGDVGIHPRNIE